MKTRFYLH